MTALAIKADRNPLMTVNKMQFMGINSAEIIMNIPSPMPKAPLERILIVDRNIPGKNLRVRSLIMVMLIHVSEKIFKYKNTGSPIRINIMCTRFGTDLFLISKTLDKIK